MICAITILPTGCSLLATEPEPVDALEFYCSQTDDFQWSQEEWDLRVGQFPVNLRREIAINERRDEWECSDDS